MLLYLIVKNIDFLFKKKTLSAVMDNISGSTKYFSQDLLLSQAAKMGIFKSAKFVFGKIKQFLQDINVNNLKFKKTKINPSSQFQERGIAQLTTTNNGAIIEHMSTVSHIGSDDFLQNPKPNLMAIKSTNLDELPSNISRSTKSSINSFIEKVTRQGFVFDPIDGTLSKEGFNLKARIAYDTQNKRLFIHFMEIDHSFDVERIANILLHQQEDSDSLEMFHSLTKTALQFIKMAHETFGNDAVSLSGHSVGGSVAMICGAITDHKTIAINPVPVDKNIILDCCQSQNLFLKDKTEEEMKLSLEQHRKNITVVSVKGELTSQTNLMTPTTPNLHEPHEPFCKYELVLRSASASKSFRKHTSQIIGVGVTLLQTLLGSVKLHSSSSHVTPTTHSLNALQKHTMEAATEAFMEAMKSQDSTQNISWLKDHDQPQFSPSEASQEKLRQKRDKPIQKQNIQSEVGSVPQRPQIEDVSAGIIGQTDTAGHEDDMETEHEDDLSDGSVPESDLSDDPYFSDNDHDEDIFAENYNFQDDSENIQEDQPTKRPGFFKSLWDRLFKK